MTLHELLRTLRAHDLVVVSPEQMAIANKVLVGKTEIPRWVWSHVVLVRDGEKLQVYLNGRLEIDGTAAAVTINELLFGGRSDNEANWEGRLDEIAIFDRALTAQEAARLMAD